jgi:hypothetical protein
VSRCIGGQPESASGDAIIKEMINILERKGFLEFLGRDDMHAGNLCQLTNRGEVRLTEGLSKNQNRRTASSASIESRLFAVDDGRNEVRRSLSRAQADDMARH